MIVPLKLDGDIMRLQPGTLLRLLRDPLGHWAWPAGWHDQQVALLMQTCTEKPSAFESSKLVFEVLIGEAIYYLLWEGRGLRRQAWYVVDDIQDGMHYEVYEVEEILQAL